MNFPRNRQGRVTIRKYSVNNDKITDYHVVSGGGHKTVFCGSRKYAETVANARRRVIQKHKARRNGYGISYLPGRTPGSKGHRRRKQYWGIMKEPKDAWPSKRAARKSHAYKRLQRKGRSPRIRKW